MARLFHSISELTAVEALLTQLHSTPSSTTKADPTLRPTLTFPSETVRPLRARALLRRPRGFGIGARKKISPLARLPTSLRRRLVSALSPSLSPLYQHLASPRASAHPTYANRAALARRVNSPVLAPAPPPRPRTAATSLPAPCRPPSASSAPSSCSSRAARPPRSWSTATSSLSRARSASGRRSTFGRSGSPTRSTSTPS